MKIDILTLFPKMFAGPFSESIISRGIKSNLFSITIHDLRDYTTDSRHTTDDRPYGGGPGMVMMVEPIDKAIQSIKRPGDQTRVILTAANGSLFTQQKAQEFSSVDQLIIIAGHYEGVDQRVADYLADESISIGNYVLTGGELPAMVITDSVVRLLPGVLGKSASLDEESHTQPGVLEYPHYTRPEVYKTWKVPDVLISGHHQLIKEWRSNH